MLQLSELSDWLKNTVPGIVVLAILATAAYSVLERTTRGVVGAMRARRDHQRRLNSKDAFAHGFAMGVHHKRPAQVIVYVGYHLAQLLVGLSVMIVGAIAAFTILSRASALAQFSLALFMSLFLIGIGIGTARRSLRYLRLAYSHDITPMLREGEQRFDAKGDRVSGEIEGQAPMGKGSGDAES